MGSRISGSADPACGLAAGTRPAVPPHCCRTLYLKGSEARVPALQPAAIGGRSAAGRTRPGAGAGNGAVRPEGYLGVVLDVQLVERQAAGVEQVEDRLLDDLGEVEQSRPPLLDARLPGLDLLVLLLGDAE